MEEAIMTFSFVMLALLGLVIRLVIPVSLIIIGIIQLKKNKKLGKILLILGSIYLLASIGYFIYSAIVYGL